MPIQKLLLLVLFTPSLALAQLAVQQPVVGVTAVQTSVVVPDRGTMFLGGSSSAQFGRSQYGPLRSGTSSGYSLQSTSVSTSVYIHDLQSMDEEILNSVRKGSPNRIQGMPVPVPVVPPTPELSSAEKMAKFEQLAKKADQDGRSGLAKLYWQTAAKHGSKIAEKRLAEVTTSAKTDRAEQTPRR